MAKHLYLISTCTVTCVIYVSLKVLFYVSYISQEHYHVLMEIQSLT